MKRASVNATRLADAMGVSDTAVGKWIDSGKIARDRIVGICNALGCSSDELLGIVEIADEPRSEPVRLFTKEQRADDDVEALRIAVQATAKAILTMTQGSAGIFLAEMKALAEPQSFSTEHGLLGRLSGIAREVQSSAKAEAQAARPSDPGRRTKRGK